MAITKDEIKASWIELRRATILRERYPVKAGPDATILIQSTPRNWGAIVLPDGSCRFMSDADRDAVLKELIAP